MQLLFFVSILLLTQTAMGRQARVVVCVPGMSVDIKSPLAVWGEKQPGPGNRWSGMLGFFQRHGYVFSGVIGAGAGFAKKRLQRRDNRIFLLRFSRQAVVDGIGMKTMELAQALRRIRRRAGVDRVIVVAHSAGGLVARAYMQGAVAGTPYRGDISRLVTISTPHFGSQLAVSVGDYLGTRATSLQAGASLIRSLNERLSLPDDTLYASVVVRGDLSDFMRMGENFFPYINRKRYQALPASFKRGSDQVIHAVNQNLSLAPTASQYERRTGRPVVYPLVVVPLPSMPARRPEMNKVHNYAMTTAALQEVVHALVDSDGYWQRTPLRSKSGWIQREARLFAIDAMIDHILSGHLLTDILSVDLNALQPRLNGQRKVVAGFSGTVTWRGLGFAEKPSEKTAYTGSLSCLYDAFGRPRTVQARFSGHGEER